MTTWGLHEGGGSNPHLHFCFGTRLIDERAAGLSIEDFFKRGAVESFSTNTNDKKFLAETKAAWLDYANYAARKEGLDVELVGGTLEEQRALALKKFKEARDLSQRADLWWWYAKTHRPVTTHLGQQAATGDTETAGARRQKFRRERRARDTFLMRLAAAAEFNFARQGYPIPAECADLAAQYHLRNPTEFPEISGIDVAVPPMPPPPPPEPKKMSTLNSQFSYSPIDNSGGRRPSRTTGRISTIQVAEAQFIKPPTARPQAYFWQRYYGGPCDANVALNIAFFDARRGTIRTVSRDTIIDKRDELRATAFNEVTLGILFEQCKAKGWTEVELDGAEPWVYDRFAAAGFRVVNATAQQQGIRLGAGPGLDRYGFPQRQNTQPPQDQRKPPTLIPPLERTNQLLTAVDIKNKNLADARTISEIEEAAKSEKRHYTQEEISKAGKLREAMTARELAERERREQYHENRQRASEYLGNNPGAAQGVQAPRLKM